MKRSYFIRTLWDEAAKVFYSESDIVGLHIEAATLEEFEAVMNDVAIDLVMANHVSLPDFADTPMRDLIPAIIWQRPELAASPA